MTLECNKTIWWNVGYVTQRFRMESTYWTQKHGDSIWTDPSGTGCGCQPKNRGIWPPKWMVYNGKPSWNSWFGGIYPYFWKHPCRYTTPKTNSVYAPENRPKLPQKGGPKSIPRIHFQVQFVSFRDGTSWNKLTAGTPKTEVWFKWFSFSIGWFVGSKCQFSGVYTPATGWPLSLGLFNISSLKFLICVHPTDPSNKQQWELGELIFEVNPLQCKSVNVVKGMPSQILQPPPHKKNIEGKYRIAIHAYRLQISPSTPNVNEEKF